MGEGVLPTCSEGEKASMWITPVKKNLCASQTGSMNQYSGSYEETSSETRSRASIFSTCNGLGLGSGCGWG